MQLIVVFSTLKLEVSIASSDNVDFEISVSSNMILTMQFVFLQRWNQMLQIVIIIVGEPSMKTNQESWETKDNKLNHKKSLIRKF